MVTTTDRTTNSRGSATVPLAIGAVTVVVALVAGVLGEMRDAWSAGIGGALVLLNLLAYALLSRPIVRRLRAGGAASRGAGVKLAVLLVLKMLVLFAIVGALVRYRIVAPVAFLAGLSALPVGAALGGFLLGRSAAPPPDPS
jgi:hypothetical protein